MKIKNKVISKTNIKIEQYEISKGLKPKDISLDIVTEIASVCYQSNSKGNEKLYDMLLKESHNLPSTSFEFVPIELDYIIAETIAEHIPLGSCNIVKYGYKKDDIWITNLRALLYDRANGYITETLFETIMNKEYKHNHYVYFFSNMNLYTFGQFCRHRDLSLQILSRRYTSDKKEPIEFNLDGVKDKDVYEELHIILDYVYESYRHIINLGTKKEVARGVLPQFATTQGWFRFNTITGRDNFFNLRTEKKTQEELRGFALALKELIVEGEE